MIKLLKIIYILVYKAHRCIDKTILSDKNEFSAFGNQ